jgi:hypothetical protein
MRIAADDSSGGEGGVLASPLGTALAVFTIAGALGGCFSRDHPDFERYEYLSIEGTFQPPYTEFPSGTDRANWKCYDGKTNREFDARSCIAAGRTINISIAAAGDLPCGGRPGGRALGSSMLLEAVWKIVWRGIPLCGGL